MTKSGHLTRKRYKEYIYDYRRKNTAHNPLGCIRSGLFDPDIKGVLMNYKVTVLSGTKMIIKLKSGFEIYCQNVTDFTLGNDGVINVQTLSSDTKRCLTFDVEEQIEELTIKELTQR